MTLFVHEWLNLYAACYEMKTKFTIEVHTEANTAADITSEEGHQGCPFGSALFRLGLRLEHLLVRHARGTAVDPGRRGCRTTRQQGTWEEVFGASTRTTTGRGATVISWRKSKTS